MKFTLYILLFSLVSYSQQNGQSSLYFFNQSFYNPAYINISDGVSIISTARNQWVNFKGAPKTSNLTIYSSVANNTSGGLTLQIDQLGATRNSSFFGNFGYKLAFHKKKNPYLIKILKIPVQKREFNYLAFGLSFGVNYYQSLFSSLNVTDNSDEVYLNGYNYSQTKTNLGFGLMYYNSIGYLGASIPTLINNKLNEKYQTATEKRHLYITGGILKQLKNDIIFRPSFVIKIVENAPISLDLGASFLFSEKLWIGGMFRVKNAIGLHLVYTTKSNLKLGYAFDYSLTAMQRYSAGSHEVMIGYNIKSNKRKSVFLCPKF